ncbi:MAG TPA: AmmeMemoRadiSam system protein B [candidate division Zixibacteria bacterium]|nr:AmmeMemoRadiSam system protein B [candidate division Zixibacteria bacterium]
MYYLTTVAVVFLTMANALAVRMPAVSGSFYPSDSTELSVMVNSHLDAVKNLPKIDGEVIALVVPHAGLIYSGPIAAHAYKLIEGADFDKVVLCGPSHSHGFEGSSVGEPGEMWQTPLGQVMCDSVYCRLLSQTPGISIHPEAHRTEHSIEVQLPYLQTVLKDFTIVPIILGYPRPEAIRALSEGLKALPTDDKVLLIASTDWQHYRPRAAGWPMDSLGIDCLTSFDPDRLDRMLTERKVEACGGSVLLAVMRAAQARGANKAMLLDYGDSGDRTGETDRVVGYVAAVMYKSRNGGENRDMSSRQKEDPEVAVLTQEQKETLLRIARESLTGYLDNGVIPEFDINDEQLKRLGAAFVTITKEGQLRGCIGHTQAVEPLYKTVAYCAVQAGVADPRFPPVSRLEVNGLHFEISVLTPMQQVNSVDEIEVGRDGLMLVAGQHRGLLLPQVATDYGWNREEFLQNTCRKASLPTDAWRQSSTEIYRFQALVFEERQSHSGL